MTSPIDYANASYTRVYNEDPAELEFAGWRARALLWHIQRKMSQGGVFRFGAMDMVAFISRRTGIPESDVSRELPVLLKLGVLILRDGALVDPEFVASQTTSKSNKLRQREHRDRHREEALSSPPPQETGDLFSGESNNLLRVTDVTHGEEKVSDSEVSSLSSERSEQDLRQNHDGKVVHLRKSTPPPSNPPTPDYDSNELSRDFSRLRSEAGFGTFKPQRSDYDARQHVIDWARTNHPQDTRRAALDAIEGFLKHAGEWEIRRRYNFKDFAADPGSWLAAKRRGIKPLRKTGAVFAPEPASPQEDIDRDALNNPRELCDPIAAGAAE